VDANWAPRRMDLRQRHVQLAGTTPNRRVSLVGQESACRICTAMPGGSNMDNHAALVET